MPALVVTRDGKQSRLFRWDEGSIGIGRHESNDLFLSDKTVSRWHAALFEREDGGWRLRDLGRGRPRELGFRDGFCVFRLLP